MSRSDTVSRPSPAMREAIATAAVGDDVFKDDPTVNELERKVLYFYMVPRVFWKYSDGTDIINAKTKLFEMAEIIQQLSVLKTYSNAL